MERRILQQSPDQALQHNVYLDDDVNTAVVETVQDVEPILKTNKELRNSGRNTRAQSFIGASVPIHLHYKWVREWKEHHADKWELGTYLAMKVNSRDYSELRTTDMKI